MNDFSAYRTAELAEAYDASYSFRGDIAFWRAMASTAGGGPLLELGCGTGRVLLPLAEDGNDITGLDLSAPMLQRCRTKLEALPQGPRLRAQLVHADMTSFDLGRSYAAIFCAFNSFHHLRTVEEQLGCLESCHAHLPPQGMLVLDLFNPDPAPDQVSAAASDEEPHVETTEWTEGRRVRRWLSRCDYNRALQCNECEMTYEIVEANGTSSQLRETFPLRLVHRYELEHLLARCGFRLVALYGDYDRSRFTDESIGMIAVALREGRCEPGRT